MMLCRGCGSPTPHGRCEGLATGERCPDAIVLDEPPYHDPPRPVADPEVRDLLAAVDCGHEAGRRLRDTAQRLIDEGATPRAALERVHADGAYEAERVRVACERGLDPAVLWPQRGDHGPLPVPRAAFRAGPGWQP